MKSDKETFYKNRGVERNKKPLKNIVYIFEVNQLKESATEEQRKEYEKYKFKDLGYIVMLYRYQTKDAPTCWHGFVTVDEVKERIGAIQWAKFCQGKREFIIQRRIDKHNKKKQK